MPPGVGCARQPRSVAPGGRRLECREANTGEGVASDGMLVRVQLLRDHAMSDQGEGLLTDALAWGARDPCNGSQPSHLTMRRHAEADQEASLHEI
ncbi:MAG: hypothetical protein C4346_02705 [Chloroflexota bacterium]